LHGAGLTYRDVMDRRRFLLAAGAVVPAMSLGACGEARSSRRVASDAAALREAGIFFDAAALTMVDIIAEIMIPQTGTPGARAVDVAGFADAMLAGWAKESTRADVRAMTIWLDEHAETRHGHAFLALASDAQADLVSYLDDGVFTAAPQGRSGDSAIPGAVARGFRHLKKIVYTGYYLSEAGATQELHYEHVPGDFRGCVPLGEIGRTWAV